MERRTFIALPLAAAAQTAAPTIQQSGAAFSVRTSSYSFSWSAESDRFELRDPKSRRVVGGPLQPLVVVRSNGVNAAAPGKLASKSAEANRLSVTYEGANSTSTLSFAIRFESTSIWIEPLTYKTAPGHDIVSVHYFSTPAADRPAPALGHSFLVVPGLNMSPTLSPLVLPSTGADFTVWLGHGGSSDRASLAQQWALPALYFCGFHRNGVGLNDRGGAAELISDSFCCGLADIPAADVFLTTHSGRNALVFDYRSDLWGHLRGPATLSLGATLCITLGSDFRASVLNYQQALVRAGLVEVKRNSPAKNAILLSPQLNTWGAQVAALKATSSFDESFARSLKDGAKTHNFQAKMYVFDDKWEGTYGHLEHSAERFPNFEKFLGDLRADGFKIGMWAAFLRCEKPSEFGLDESNMIRGADGKPVRFGSGPGSYFLFDFTQPKVAALLRELAQKYMRRYKPDLVKFDFGYELPSVSRGMPQDTKYAGERLLFRGVEIVIGAMREINPDLVVMYYALSPLFAKYMDLHSPDDMVLAVNEYDLEANRRFYFSSILAELGIPTYGSGGYDWPTVPSIWFDSAAIGTLGTLNSFLPDETNSIPTPDRVAKYNGISKLLRKTTRFTVQPLDPPSLSASRFARSSSWARLEDGKPTLLALRSHNLDGSANSGAYAALVKHSASVVVSSLTADPLPSSKRIGVVPYGNGSLHLRTASKARLTTHLFGGKSTTSASQSAGGWLTIPLMESANGTPVEWIDVVLE